MDWLCKNSNACMRKVKNNARMDCVGSIHTIHTKCSFTINSNSVWISEQNFYFCDSNTIDFSETNLDVGVGYLTIFFTFASRGSSILDVARLKIYTIFEKLTFDLMENGYFSGTFYLQAPLDEVWNLTFGRLIKCAFFEKLTFDLMENSYFSATFYLLAPLKEV